MRVVLLCAGYATRLYPLTLDQPKALLPVRGRPILEWILDSFKGIDGIEAVYVVSNHKFAGHFRRWSGALPSSWPVEVVDDGTMSNEDRLGAIGDLNFVLQKKKIANEDLLVIAGDNFFDFNLLTFLEKVKAKRPDPVLVVHDVQDLALARQYGIVTVGAEGRVEQFLEKPKNPPSTLASCGIYWFPAEARDLLDKYLAAGHNPDQPGFFMSWLALERRLVAVSLDGKWIDIGDQRSYERANRECASHLKTNKRMHCSDSSP